MKTAKDRGAERWISKINGEMNIPSAKSLQRAQDLTKQAEYQAGRMGRSLEDGPETAAGGQEDVGKEKLIQNSWKKLVGR